MVIAHRLSTIKHADNIVVMSEGRIIEQGSHDELLEKKEAYYNLIEAQRIATKQESRKQDEDFVRSEEDDILPRLEFADKGSILGREAHEKKP